MPNSGFDSLYISMSLGKGFSCLCLEWQHNLILPFLFVCMSIGKIFTFSVCLSLRTISFYHLCLSVFMYSLFLPCLSISIIVFYFSSQSVNTYFTFFLSYCPKYKCDIFLTCSYLSVPLLSFSVSLSLSLSNSLIPLSFSFCVSLYTLSFSVFSLKSLNFGCVCPPRNLVVSSQS